MNEPPSIREAARFALVRHVVHDDAALDRAFISALKLSADTLGVERVGIWMFEANGTCIRCSMAYERTSGSTAKGEIIDLTTSPLYAEALHTRRVVTADDAREDPRTAELLPYLTRHGITSLLDSPVFQQGDVVAVVCHEHVGPKRVWTKQDKHFVATVSDMLGLYLEQHAAQAYYQDLLQARQELQQHRVMESLGRMATSVAHDFNNLLLAIGLKTDLMLMDERSEESRKKALEEVHAIIDQGARLVRQLLDFAKHEVPPADVIDLGQVLRALEPNLRTLEQGGITLTLKSPATPTPIRIEHSRAEQVIMNLASNARDALLGGGQLTIECSAQTQRSGEKVAVLRVIDTGVGMDENTREHMFEPFFTTKPKGKGDGLGLATVYNIVTSSGGSLEVQSEVGEGSVFIVRWPLLERTP